MSTGKLETDEKKQVPEMKKLEGAPRRRGSFGSAAAARRHQRRSTSFRRAPLKGTPREDESSVECQVSARSAKTSSSDQLKIDNNQKEGDDNTVSQCVTSKMKEKNVSSNSAAQIKAKEEKNINQQGVLVNEECQKKEEIKKECVAPKPEPNELEENNSGEPGKKPRRRNSFGSSVAARRHFRTSSLRARRSSSGEIKVEKDPAVAAEQCQTTDATASPQFSHLEDKNNEQIAAPSSQLLNASTSIPQKPQNEVQSQQDKQEIGVTKKEDEAQLLDQSKNDENNNHLITQAETEQINEQGKVEESTPSTTAVSIEKEHSTQQVLSDQR